MTDHLRVLSARMRTNLRAFVRKGFEILNPGTQFLDNWHIAAIAYRLEQCMRGDINRLIINMSPRSLKSEITSVIFVAWLLGLDPSKKIICVSYSDDLARVFARMRRKLMESAEYRDLFPNTRISAEKNTEAEIVTTRGGGCYATGIDGTLRGRGADVIVIDDPVKSGSMFSMAERKHVNDWYSETLYSRLNSKRDGIIILVMQRIHAEDLTGYVRSRDAWDRLELPAIARETMEHRLGPKPEDVYVFKAGEPLHPAREDLGVLEDIQRTIGNRAFESQYQQCPTPPEGNIIKVDWLKRYEGALSGEKGDQCYQSWDTASSSAEAAAYSVCTTWLVRRDTFYLVDVFRGRLVFPDLVKKVMDLSGRFKPQTILIEKASTGQSVIDTLKGDARYPVKGIPPKGSKADRFEEASLLFEQGRVCFPREAPWLGDFEHEILGFPEAKFSDQVDSVSQFLRWVGENQKHRLATSGAGPNTIYGKPNAKYFGKRHPQRNPNAPRRRPPR